MVQTSKTRASIGRVLLVFCPALWEGAQPGMVSNGPFDEPEPGDLSKLGQAVNVNALVDAANHPKALEFWRSRSAGNTLCSLPLYDALSEEQRAELMTHAQDWSDRPFAWAEWMPYQVGQAQKNTDDVGKFAGRLDRIEAALARLLSDPGALSADAGHLERCRITLVSGN